MDSLYGDAMLGGMGLLSVVGAVAYIIPVFALGFVLYFFTGDKKPGEKIINNFMRASLRFHNYVWMFVGTVVVYSGLNKALSYIFQEILPDAEKTSPSLYGDYDYETIVPSTSTPSTLDDKVLVMGLVYMFIGLAVFATFLAFNFMIQTKEEKMGTLSTKLYAILGLLTFSIMLFSGLLGSAQALVDYAYDTDMGLAPGSFAMLFASTFVGLFYLWKSLYVFKKESK